LHFRELDHESEKLDNGLVYGLPTRAMNVRRNAKQQSILGQMQQDPETSLQVFFKVT